MQCFNNLLVSKLGTIYESGLNFYIQTFTTTAASLGQSFSYHCHCFLQAVAGRSILTEAVWKSNLLSCGWFSLLYRHATNKNCAEHQFLQFYTSKKIKKIPYILIRMSSYVLLFLLLWLRATRCLCLCLPPATSGVNSPFNALQQVEIWLQAVTKCSTTWALPGLISRAQSSRVTIPRR